MKNIILFGLLIPGLSHAQTLAIDWYKVAGTNGSSVFSVSGTIGQPDAGGALTGGNYSLTGGFWSIISVVQTVNAPVLTIVRSGASVVVSWPSSATGFLPQQTTNLAAAVPGDPKSLPGLKVAWDAFSGPRLAAASR